MKDTVVGIFAFLLASPFGLLSGVLALGIVVVQRDTMNFDALDWLRNRPLVQVSAAVGVVGLVVAVISLVTSRTAPHTRGITKWRTDEIAEEYQRLDVVRKGAVELDQILKGSVDDWYRVCFPHYGLPLHDRDNLSFGSGEETRSTRFVRDYERIRTIAAEVPEPWTFTADVRRSLPYEAWDYLLELGVGKAPGVLMATSRWSDSANPPESSPLRPNRDLYSLAATIESDARRLRNVSLLPPVSPEFSEQLNRIAATLAQVTRQASATDRRTALAPLRDEAEAAIDALYAEKELEEADRNTLRNWCYDVRDLAEMLERLDDGMRASMNALCELQLIVQGCHRSLYQHLWPQNRFHRIRARLG